VGTVLEIQELARKTPARWKADLALATVALAWGATFVVVKAVLAEISTVYFLALRFWLAALYMALLFAGAFRRAGWHAVLKGLKGGAIAGVFLWAGYILQTFGLKYTTAGKSGFLTGLYIVLLPLLSAGLYKQWPQISELLGLTIAAVGLILLTLPSLDTTVNLGDLLTVGCAVAFAIHLLVLGHYSQREKFEAVALGQIVSAAVLSTCALFIEKPHALWSVNVVIALLMTSVFATAIAFALQTWGQQYTTSTRTALIFALEPVFALFTAVALGGEMITLNGSVGAALILGGILLVELKPLKNR
jgi:drug/metabolite transporter (DMT)-like permease